MASKREDNKIVQKFLAASPTMPLCSVFKTETRDPQICLGRPTAAAVRDLYKPVPKDPYAGGTKQARRKFCRSFTGRLSFARSAQQQAFTAVIAVPKCNLLRHANFTNEF
jgi:hypothetical protein